MVPPPTGRRATAARARRGIGRRLLGSLVGGLGLGALGVLSASTPAWAHVTVHPTSVPAGTSDVELTFRVPNERDDANTVELQVFFPTGLPLLAVDVLPVAGWTATVHTQNLATPVHTDDGPVSQIVSDVTWSATNGGIGPGQYEDFVVAAGSVPDHPGRLVFKALQTYSSGEIVRWIEVPVAGQPAPDNPAPVLTLTPAASSPGVSSSSETMTSDPDTIAEVLASVALAVAAVSLLVVVRMARDRRDRSPSPS